MVADFSPSADRTHTRVQQQSISAGESGTEGQVCIVVNTSILGRKWIFLQIISITISLFWVFTMNLSSYASCCIVTHWDSVNVGGSLLLCLPCLHSARWTPTSTRRQKRGVVSRRRETQGDLCPRQMKIQAATHAILFTVLPSGAKDGLQI